MNIFKVSYVTTLPKEGNAPRVTISGDIPHIYNVYFYEYNVGLISSGQCQTNQTIIAKTKQWYTDWLIIITDENDTVVFEDFFNLNDKVVFIKMDAYALGDNIAWMPYIEEFRAKHNCKVICSTFWNNLFKDVYEDIMFVEPNTKIENVYAQYYIGANDEENPYYCPVKSKEVPLQMVASATLGLEYMEIQPNLALPYEFNIINTNKKFVTLSEHGSSINKTWKAENGWQQVVDFLVSKGYDVVVISKEPTMLKNVVNMTGNIELKNRIFDILHAEFHLGVSSGLSWLAWALGKHVVMISDVTPKWHEFQSNVTRIGGEGLTHVNYSAEEQTNIEEVLRKLSELVV
jgi:autotransporter strand-loop-strand O-heptosyltransferase